MNIVKIYMNRHNGFPLRLRYGRFEADKDLSDCCNLHQPKCLVKSVFPQEHYTDYEAGNDIVFDPDARVSVPKVNSDGRVVFSQG